MKMIYRKYIFIILAFFMILAACEKEEIKRPFARLETLPVTELDSSGVTFNATLLTTPDDANIIDYGFVWRNAPFNRATDFPSGSRNISLGNELNAKDFSTRLTTGLADREIYYVRAYIRSDEWLVYGNQRSFFSQGGEGPVIESLLPEGTVVPGDTLVLTGRNFGTEDISVQVGEEIAPLLTANDTEISLILPRLIEDGDFISVANRFKEKAIIPLPPIAKPEILNITPSAIAEGDTVLIEGRNFSSRSEWNKVQISVSSQSSIISTSQNQIKFVLTSLSYNTSNSHLKVRVGKHFSNEIPFTYAPVQITDFFPKEGAPGDTITILGKNFFNNPDQHFVTFDDKKQWPVIESNSSTLKVLISEVNLGLSSSASGKIKVEAAGNTAVTPEYFTYINEDWTFLSSLPNNSTDYSPTMFVANDEIYYHLKQNNTIWRFDRIDQNWELVGEAPTEFNDGYIHLATSVDDDAVLVFRPADFNDSLHIWRFNGLSDTWSEMPAIRIRSEWLSSSTIFSIEQNLYMCFSDRETECRVLNNGNEFWHVMPSYNGLFLYPVSSASLDGKGYLIAREGNSSRDIAPIFEFNPMTNSWTRLGFETFTWFPSNQGAVALNGKIYFLGLFRPDFYAIEWNPAIGQSRRWELLLPPTDDTPLREGTSVATSDGVFVVIRKYLYQWHPRQ